MESFRLQEASKSKSESTARDDTESCCGECSERVCNRGSEAAHAVFPILRFPIDASRLVLAWSRHDLFHAITEAFGFRDKARAVPEARHRPRVHRRFHETRSRVVGAWSWELILHTSTFR